MNIPPLDSPDWALFPVENLLAFTSHLLEDHSPEQLLPLKPHLLRALGERTQEYEVVGLIETFSQIDPSATAEILDHLRPRTDLDLYDEAIHSALAASGPNAADALIDALLDPEEHIRDLAGMALAELDAQRGMDVRALLRPLARIAPPGWPGHHSASAPNPANLSRFLGDPTGFHPLRSAPDHVGNQAGVVYFEAEQDWSGVCRWLLQHLADCTEYAVFVDVARDPSAESYLVQARLVHPEDLWNVFGCTGGDSEHYRQPRTLMEFVDGFVRHQRAYWGECDRRSPLVQFGGQTDRGGIGFGFLREGSLTYRIWSRPIAITK